jgi:hypothetical protein
MRKVIAKRLENGKFKLYYDDYDLPLCTRWIFDDYTNIIKSEDKGKFSQDELEVRKNKLNMYEQIIILALSKYLEEQ